VGLYFTVSDSRLPFPSPPTTRRATVEVFDPASTQDRLGCPVFFFITPRRGPRRQHRLFSRTNRFSLPRERVYRSTAQKLVWYNCPSHGRCIPTTMQAALLQSETRRCSIALDFKLCFRIRQNRQETVNN
jgi:hypothetical protein